MTYPNTQLPAMPSAEMPFGGIKDSGYGSEGGPEAVEAYLNTRAVTVMNVRRADGFATVHRPSAAVC